MLSSQLSYSYTNIVLFFSFPRRSPGKVYNVTRYMRFHPGGVDYLMQGAGKDATRLFNKYHKWVNAEFMLQRCLVGVLERT